MRRVAWVWAAAVAAAILLVGCGDARPAAAAFTSTCTGCHSGPDEAPPFRDRTGSTDATRASVGAHDVHLYAPPRFGEPDISQRIACAECHTVPGTVGDAGHLEDAPTDIRFGTLARTGGVEPEYEEIAPGAQGCSASYCHGNFPGGNADNVPRWAGGSPREACGTCHALPPGTGKHAQHVGVTQGGAAVTCNDCHGPVVPATHVNGVKNVIIPQFNRQFRTCAQACHQAREWGQ